MKCEVSALLANPVIQSVRGGCCPLSMRMYVNFYYKGGGGGGPCSKVLDIARKDFIHSSYSRSTYE